MLRDNRKEHCLHESYQALAVCQIVKSRKWSSMTVQYWWNDLKKCSESLLHCDFVHLKSHGLARD